MNKHLNYAGYILRHKWFVLVECAKRGILWRGLMHDMSKLLPSEWVPYANFFYGDVRCPNSECGGSGWIWKRGVSGDTKNLPLLIVADKCSTCNGKGRVPKGKTIRNKTGYYKPTDTGDTAFDFAWLLHQKRNRHHWQWWVLPEDDGGSKVLPMPEPYRTEMICDWLGAGRALGTPSVNAWYKKNGRKMQLHPSTRAWVEQQLTELP